MMRIITPKVSVDPGHSPVFFLAGPVLGGGDWQADMCLELAARIHPEREFFIAVPCRWDKSHALVSHFCESDGKMQFDRQLTWERHYLDLAGGKGRFCISDGCIAFWLAAESKTFPRRDGNPYARDTYGELGRWITWKSIPKYIDTHHPLHIRLVIGAEEAFPGLDCIRRNANFDLGEEFPFCKTLGDTAASSVKTVFGEYAMKSIAEENAIKKERDQEYHQRAAEIEERLRRGRYVPLEEDDEGYGKLR